MKTILALALVGLLGFMVAGCGATKKIAVKIDNGFGPHTPVAVSGTKTIRNVKTGARVTCEGWAGQGVRVPPRGQAVVGFASKLSIPGKKSPALDQMSLKHLQNGSIRVTCKPSS